MGSRNLDTRTSDGADESAVGRLASVGGAGGFSEVSTVASIPSVGLLAISGSSSDL